MKKLALAVVLFAAVVTTVSAQGGPGGDPAAIKQKMREMVKPQIVEKTKITAEQADKVLDINMEAQQQRRDVRRDANLSDEEKTKKYTAIDEETTKKYKALPLTDDQVKSVNAFFDEWRKNNPGRPRNGGGQGNGNN